MNCTISGKDGYPMYFDRKKYQEYTMVDLNVLPDEEEILLGGEVSDGFIKKICLRGVMKQFPQVKKIIIHECVYQIEISNFMFPNVEIVESKSSAFKSGKYLMDRNSVLLNTFCQKEDSVLDIAGITDVKNYALEGCRFSRVENSKLSKIYSLYKKMLAGCLIMPEDPNTGMLCFGDYIYSVDETAEEVCIPDTVKGFAVGIRLGKKITLKGANALEKLSRALRENYNAPEIHLEISDAAEAAKIITACRNNTPNAKKITVSDNPYLTSADGILYTKDMRKLICCPSGKEGVITVPEGVESISKCGFYESNISGVILPDSLREIEDGAFGSCPKLTDVSFGHGITELTGIDLFCRCESLKQIILPPQIRKIGAKAFRYCICLESIILNEGLEEIGDDAFEYAGPAVKEISLPGSVRKLGKMAFPDVDRIYLHGNMPAGLIQSAAADFKPAFKGGSENCYVECVTESGRRFFIPRYIDNSQFDSVCLQFDLFGDADGFLDLLYNFSISPDVKQICALKSYKESKRPETGQYLRRCAKNIINGFLKNKDEAGIIDFVDLGLVTPGMMPKLLEKSKEENMLSLTAYLLQTMEEKKAGGKFRL